ncbi:uncharacterized protein [Euwallacea fornicatus]|uniref:uncharacterized protein isoform X1 n=1 Tax=Euwallacea fornicatus TaxID=995702 RepID=UPI00338FA6DE
MAESIIKAVRCNRKKKRKMKNKPLSSSPADVTTSTLGERLSEDHWFIQKTLPFILPLLGASDVINCGKVCKSWRSIIVSGERLSKDEWLVHNTLPFILPYLEVPDVLRCMRVCKLWQEVVNESTFWRSIRLNRYTLNLDKMVSFLQDVGTKNLRITECKISDDEHDCLRTGEQLNPDESEALQVSVQMYPGSTKLDIYLWGSTASLFKELQPHRLTCLSELRTLKSLVLTKIFGLKRDYKRKQQISSSRPQLTHCSTLVKFIQSHLNNIHPLKYLSFLIYECPKFSLMKTISDLGFLPNFRGLHLLEIPIMEGFEDALNLCTDLKFLRLSPLFRKRHVARDNGRIFEGVKKLKLRNFIWIFSNDYTFQCDKLVTEEMSGIAQAYVNHDFLIPFIGNADFLHDDFHESEQQLPSFRLVEWSDLQDELKALMVGCRVQIIMNPIY